MSDVKPEPQPDDDVEPFTRNAQRGQNRTGVEVEADVTFDEYEAHLPIDPHAADDRIADEGPEIRARIHDRGNDVVAEDDDSDGSNAAP